MAQPGFGGALDTPRTNIGDATYLRQPDFADISQEASFQSPGRDGNLLSQLRNGRGKGVNLRTPRQRGPLSDRRNLPPSVGGAEFTPLLKSATRNSARRQGKENGAGAAVPNTPALARIDEDELTPLAKMDTSIFPSSRNQSYLETTLPQIDSSSVASTPLALSSRKRGDHGPLQDGNQLSLKEQENVINRIEKENFGLKLKIHFLEEALRKAGPGFSEAALKENTELKVDKVTMQRELHRYKKHVTTAERDLESYRQQMTELQETASRKTVDENQRAEMDKLRQTLEEREADIEHLNSQLRGEQQDQDKLEQLQDNIEDLEADLREKERLISDREDEIENLKDHVDEAEEKVKDAERKVKELDQGSQQNEELDEAKDNIQDLEQNIRRLEDQLDEVQERADEAEARKDRAERDLEELQEEMANKSVVTKGLSRQIEEKVVRLQEELDKAGQEYSELEKEFTAVNQENDALKTDLENLRHESENARGTDKATSGRIRELEAEILALADEKDLLQSRHDTLMQESASLHEDVEKLERESQELETNLREEREYVLEVEKDLRNQYNGEIERLNDEISDLQAEIREKDNLYDNDSEKWETEKHTLSSERDRIEEKANGLQRTIDRLRQAEGSLSDKELKLQEALQSETQRHKSEEGVMNRQIDDLQDALETRQNLLTTIRNELSTVRDELRQTQIDYQTQAGKVVTLEDEVSSLQMKLSSNATSSFQDADATKRECNDLREQLRTLRQAREPSMQRSPESTARLRWQLSDANSKLDSMTKDKESLQEQLTRSNSELQSVRSSLSEAKAERDEIDEQLRPSKPQDNDTLRMDQNRLDLRTAKMKLDIEVRRLKDENKILSEQRDAVEQTLEDEIKAAAENEDRLRQEVSQLQTQLRQASTSDSHDTSSSRRTIRDLERQIEDYENRLATVEAPTNADGHSELSVARKDLHTSRQKELELAQQEAVQRDVVRNLRRQVADLERQVHDNELERVATSPHRAKEHGDREYVQGLEQQLSDLEDQRTVLEELLEETRLQAEEAAAQNDKILRRLKVKLDKAERDRATASASRHGSNQHDRNLRKSQAEIENLEHDVRQQQELIDGLMSAEASLRRKLERTRSERAAYRMSAEKLQRDVQRLQHGAAVTTRSSLLTSKGGALPTRAPDPGHAIETIVRAAEGAEERHKKEIRGMVMQMEWMQARWEREASLRSDAAFAKKFIQLQLDVANACNKAQLRELEHIRTNLLNSRKPLNLPSSASASTGVGDDGSGASRKPSLRTFLVMARFIARMRLGARSWAQQEAVRQKLVSATEERRRSKRASKFKVVRVDETA